MGCFHVSETNRTAISSECFSGVQFPLWDTNVFQVNKDAIEDDLRPDFPIAYNVLKT